MDYRLTELQEAVTGLAAQVIGNSPTPEAVPAQKEGSRFDPALWTQLAETGLLGAAVSEAAGGMGGGAVEACLVLEQIGLHAATAPVWPGLLAATAIDRFGAPEARQRWVVPFIQGELQLTTAFDEADATASSASPVRAQPDGEGWLIAGVASMVPIADRADAVVIAAAGDGDRALYLVDPNAPGVRLRPQHVTSGDYEFEMTLDGVAAERLCDCAVDSPASRWLRRFGLVGLCALETGLADGAIRLTAAYASERQQFGRALATMQSVQHRLVDAYISAQAMRWTMWQAAAALDSDAEMTDRALLVACTWATEAGAKILTAAQHLHGGVGVDTSYPLHRFYLDAKRTELLIGSTSGCLERLGDLEAQASDLGDSTGEQTAPPGLAAQETGR